MRNPSIDPFSARYETHCADCDDWIYEGDWIRMSDDGAIHHKCGRGFTTPPTPGEVCPACFCTKPCFCEDEP